jgi:hypothetical protein
MWIEDLESRRLLAASLSADGTLLVAGTGKADVVTFAPPPGFDNPNGNIIAPDSSFVVSINGKSRTFRANDVRRVVVRLGRGHDTFDYLCIPGDFWGESRPIIVDPGPGPIVRPEPVRFIDLPIRVEGGAGDDSVLGGNNNDTLIGGTGDDDLDGGFGDDKLQGELGNDKLFGRDGQDRLDAGGGLRDTMAAGAGDDRLKADSFSLQALGGAGVDSLLARKGTRLITPLVGIEAAPGLL